MNPLDLIPLPYRLAGGALAAVLVVAAAAAFHHHQVTTVTQAAEARGAARVQALFDAYRTQVERQALQQAAARQTAQSGLQLDRKEIDDEAQRIAAQDRARLLASARSVDAADQRLQQRLDAANAAPGGGLCASAPALGASAAEPGPDARLLAAVRRFSGQLARDADAELAEADRRLGQCVAEYEAVRRRVNEAGQQVTSK